MAKPKKYTSDIADKICLCIAEGRSMRSICADDGMPAESTVYYWLSQYHDFVGKLKAARLLSADADFDHVQRIAEQVLAGDLDPRAARTAIYAYKWTASKKDPRKYGDHIKLEDVSDWRGKPIEHMSDVDLINVMVDGLPRSALEFMAHGGFDRLSDDQVQKMIYFRQKLITTDKAV